MDWMQRSPTWQEHKGRHGNWIVTENGSKQGIVSLEPQDSMFPFGYGAAHFGSMAEARLAVSMLDNVSTRPDEAEAQLLAAGYELTSSNVEASHYRKGSGKGNLVATLRNAGRGNRYIYLGYDHKNGRSGNFLAHVVEADEDAKALTKDARAETLGFDPFLLDVRTVLALGDAREKLHGSARRPLKSGEEDALIAEILAECAETAPAP